MTQIISGQALSAAARQQAQAQDTSRSAWVAASAGAGKTRVLSSRILRLLIEGEEPQGILALTYTRAAATEMANRVIEAARDLTLTSLNDRQVRVTELLGLGPDESPNQEVLDRANRLYEYILETPGGLQIQTIHSFCQSLLGRFPFEAGLTPGFKVIEDEERQHILASVAAFALSKSEPSLTTLKATVRDDAIVPLVSALVDVDWDNLDVTDRLEKFDQYLGGGFENYNVKKHQREFSSKLASRRKAISHLASLAADSAKPGDQKLSNTLFEALESRDALSILSAHFLTEGRLKKTGIHTRALDGQDVLEWLKSAILKYHSRVHSQKLFDLNSDIFKFGELVSKAFKAEKLRRSVIDFDDLISAANRLLSADSGPSYVQYRLDQKLNHVLVDEAQDTSREQWNIVAGLCDGFFDYADDMDRSNRTLFVVGDFKQSIYSFQGAEPALFDTWGKTFQIRAGERMHNIEMVHSFRSAPEILRFVDEVNGSLMHGGLSAADQPLRAHEAVQEDRVGMIQVWPVPEEPIEAEKVNWEPAKASRPSASRKQLLGQVIARHIYRICFDDSWENRPESFITDGDKVRRAQPGDFLVLVQSRKSEFAASLIGELKMLEVPVTGVDRLRMSGELVVKDLLALGEVCVQPRDDLSLAALLKSPLFGVDEEKLFDLSSTKGEANLIAKVQSSMPELAAQLSTLSRQVGQVSVYNFYANFLFSGGGRARILASAGPEAEDVLNVFLERARSFDTRNNGDLIGFIEIEKRSEQDFKRDTSESTDQVRLMTVHGAKGLEAPIVVLPDMYNLRNASSGRVLDQLVNLPTVGPVWFPTKAYHNEKTQLSRENNSRKIQAERERLLYVALTRAKERLIVCTDKAQGDRAQAGPWSWFNRCLDVATKNGKSTNFELEELGWPLSSGFQIGSPPQIGEGVQSATQDKHQSLLKFSPLETEISKLVLNPSGYGNVSAPFTESNLPPKGRELALLRGTLMHAALEHLAGVPSLNWPERLESFYSFQAPDVESKLRNSWVKETISALGNPKLAAFFTGDSLSEVSVAGMIGDQLAVGQIDRLFVDSETATVNILDYKTNRPPPVDAKKVSSNYLNQMRDYASLVAPIYPGYSIKAWLFWTYTGELMDVTGL